VDITAAELRSDPHVTAKGLLHYHMLLLVVSNGSAQYADVVTLTLQW